MKTKLLILCAALAAATGSSQAITMPGAGTLTKPRVVADPRIVDLGLAAATDVKTVSLSLAPRNADQLESFVAGGYQAGPNTLLIMTKPGSAIRPVPTSASSSRRSSSPRHTAKPRNRWRRWSAT